MNLTIKPPTSVKDLLDIPAADVRSPNLLSPEVKELSPNLWVIDDVLDRHECLSIMEEATPSLGRSTTIADREGDDTISDYRTSSQTFLKIDGYDHRSFIRSTLSKIKEKVSHYTNLSEDFQEDLQVLRYEGGQQYKSHHDFFYNDSDTFLDEAGRSGQRIFTTYIYLNDVVRGGDTYFPKKNITVKPEAGKMVIWKNMVNGKPYEESMHWGRPPIDCVKWGATLWVREAVFS